MDAVKFIEELRRMYGITGKCSPTLPGWIPADDVVKEVEEWAAAHPRKTRQSMFLKQWPEAAIDSYGVLNLCPTPISKSHRNIYGKCAHAGTKCADCRREFWTQEVE